VLHPTGARVSGHEFHRWSVTPRAGEPAAWGWRGAQPEGFVVRGVHASFLHTHPAGAPESIGRLSRRIAGRAREDLAFRTSGTAVG
jgi:cobyrinic acid a,c-diamide synthase